MLQHREMEIEGMAELTPPAIDAEPAKLPPQGLLSRAINVESFPPISPGDRQAASALRT
jgi:hypothetical protein